MPNIDITGTEAAVCQDLADRQKKGIAKYGHTVEGNPLSQREWLQHLYEELLDAAVYSKRLLTGDVEVQETPTTNIPTHFPVSLGETEKQAVIEWMKTRPAHDDDDAVNRHARWTYKVTDHGMWTDIVVVDLADGTEFEVPQDPDNW